MRYVNVLAVAGFGLAVVVGSAVRAATPAGSASVVGTPLPAVWRERRVTFDYRGRTARYSCEGLRDKVRAMLIDLGARRDVKLVATGCRENGRVRGGSARPRLRIVFSSPALTRGVDEPARSGDLAAVNARFETFMIADDAFRNMGIGDCELVDEFTRQILPKLTARDVRRNVRCVTGQMSGNRFMVQGRVLKSVPRSQPTGSLQPVTVR